MVTNFFVGANSGDGFQNLFPDIIDLEDTYDFMVLKGGPGVGKNTFMREIGRTMEAAGQNVEYLWCSGDPGSLDGVVLPEIRCAIADGTAPHIIEPKYPAAVDRYVDLGRFYDLTAAKMNAAEIKTYTHAYKSDYDRAYRCLKVARQIECERIKMVKECFDEQRVLKRMDGIIQREFQRGKGRGKTVRRFLGSLTCQGYVWRYDSVEAMCDHIYEFSDSWELAGGCLQKLHEAAIERGWNTVICVSPEAPARIEHLLVPELGVAFVTSRPGMQYEGKPYRRIRMDSMVETEEKGRLRLLKRMDASLRKEAAAALKSAHENHDRLEALYNPYVDFEEVRTLAALEAARWLSYLK